MKEILCLGIESSCDETSVSVVANGRTLLSNVINSQIEIHKKYGGVVPEVASRNHTMAIVPCIDEALVKAGITLKEIDIIAFTQGAGLIGALLVGVNAAKSLAYCTGKPLVAVEHTKAHIAANYIAHKQLQPPFCCLVASGGHTSLIKVDDYTSMKLIGSTLDDAVGEAFDKVGRKLGLSYPAGAKIDELAQKGHAYIEFTKPPNSMKKYTFSFSGLKTACINYIHKANQNRDSISLEDFCSSFTKCAIDPLIAASIQACKEFGLDKIVVAGGVAANTYLRQQMTDNAIKNNLQVFIPPLSLCTDNAAMVASLGYYNYLANIGISGLDVNAKTIFM